MKSLRQVVCTTREEINIRILGKVKLDSGGDEMITQTERSETDK